MADEKILIEYARNGDHTAFKRLYDHYVSPLYRFMKQFSSDTALVEDWVQRAFINAYRNMRSFEGRSKFSSWLFQLAINEMRMDRRRAAFIQFDAITAAEITAATESEDFEWNDSMRNWLNELSDIKKAVFILYEVEGYSHAEIASMLDIAESSSRSILARTKQFLQTQWNKQEQS